MSQGPACDDPLQPSGKGYKPWPCWDKHNNRCGCTKYLLKAPTQAGPQQMPQCTAHGKHANAGMCQMVKALKAQGYSGPIAVEWPVQDQPGQSVSRQPRGKAGAGQFTAGHNKRLDIVIHHKGRILAMELQGAEHARGNVSARDQAKKTAAEEHGILCFEIKVQDKPLVLEGSEGSTGSRQSKRKRQESAKLSSSIGIGECTDYGLEAKNILDQ